jgi:VWFA-related protein
MSGRRIFLARSLSLVLLVLALGTIARADDFGMIVHNVEKQYQAKKKKIPFLGLAGFAVKLIHPAGVKSVKFAMFEDQDFTPGERDRSFIEAVSRSLNSKWKPLVRATDRSSGNRSLVYSHKAGDDIEVLSVTFSRRQAIVVQAKVNPAAMSKFLDKPEVMGFAIAGGSNGSIWGTDHSGGGYTIGSSGGSGDTSLDSIGGTTSSAYRTDVPRSKPVLKRPSDADSEFNPLAGDAGEPPMAEPSRVETDPNAIHLEARLINLNVKATDRIGNPLPELSKQDFRIFEDGVEQDIAFFEPLSAPINVMLLLDLSGSTSESRKIMIETAKRFIDSLGPGDRIAAAAFTRRFILASDFTSDKKALKKSVDKMKKIQGGTAFYDGMWAAMDVLDRARDSRKAIVVLTDGVDNSLLDSDFEPTNYTFDELLNRVREQDATVYPIYFNPVEAELRKIMNDPENSDGRRQRAERRLQPNIIAHRQIEKLADESSGMVFVATGENELDGVYQRVAAELRLIYTLAYSPKNKAHDGKYRKIEVKVNRDSALVKTRRGYVAR